MQVSHTRLSRLVSYHHLPTSLQVVKPPGACLLVSSLLPTSFQDTCLLVEPPDVVDPFMYIAGHGAIGPSQLWEGMVLSLGNDERGIMAEVRSGPSRDSPSVLRGVIVTVKSPTRRSFVKTSCGKYQVHRFLRRY
ncbi:hypothetical protein FB451DRAFT_1388487 [Mycena latifolia]|nr:hypothetical protein FB451DRAFT_1388487 [Mycena latifolia]